MEEVSGWVFTICAGTLVCGVVSALVPSKSFEKSIQLLLGVFMLLCFLTPVTGGNWQLGAVDLEAAEQRRLEVAGQTEADVSDRLQSDLLIAATEQLVALLPQYELSIEQATLAVTRQPNDTLQLSVTLPKSAEADAQALQAAMTQSLGVSVVLGYYTEIP